MYIHQQAWAEALEVANRYDPTASRDVYVSHARAEADAGRHQHAEELFALAGKPELALSMYREAGMWPEALSLAQRQLPHCVAELSLACSQAKARRGIGGSKEDFLSAGHHWEQKQQWSRAIEAYLNARPDIIEDPKSLEEIWDCAVDVARRHLAPEECRELVINVTNKLRSINRHESAAELLRELNDLQGAVECAMDGRCWKKARELAMGSNILESEVDSAYQSALRSAADTDSLLELGHRTAALDLLVEQREWSRLWQMIDREQLQSSVGAKYAGLQAAQITAENGDFSLAIRTLRNYGAPPHEQNLEMYRKLVVGVLALDHSRTQVDQHDTLLSDLRQLLYDIIVRNDSETRLPPTKGISEYYKCGLCLVPHCRDRDKIAIVMKSWQGAEPEDNI